MKVNKKLKKEFPGIKFGKTQKAFRCPKGLKKCAPYELGSIYKVFHKDGFRSGFEYWACVEHNNNPDECVMQQLFGI